MFPAVGTGLLYWSASCAKIETLLPLGRLDPGLRAAAVPRDIGDVAEDARRAEALGYDGIITEETKDDPYIVIALAAQAFRFGYLAVRLTRQRVPLPSSENRSEPSFAIAMPTGRPQAEASSTTKPTTKSSYSPVGTPSLTIARMIL